MISPADVSSPALKDHCPRGYRIAVFAGPTGGHLFPAQSFCESFRRRFPATTTDLITSQRAKDLVAKMPAGTFNHIDYLPDFGFPVRFSLGTFKPFFLAPYLFLRSFFYLLKVRPDVCVGFASFVSYPGMMMAHWLGIPTLIHEQNLVPGKATQWLAPHMDVVTESFPGTKFSHAVKKVHTVGLPLRSGLFNAKVERNPAGTSLPLTVLVVGGSQGAQGLNAVVVEAFGQLSREERAKIVVIHITGPRDQAWVSEQYKQWALSSEVYTFYSAVNELFQKADLAITRAGANTLFELAFFGVPALVVPYPHAGGHQKYNAQCFATKGGLLYHEEGPETAVWLRGHLKDFIRMPGQLAGIAKAMAASAQPRAAEELVSLVQGLIKQS